MGKPYKRKDSSYWWVKISRGLGRQPLLESTRTTDYKRACEYFKKRQAEMWEQDRLGVKPKRSWKEAVVRYMEETSIHNASHETDMAHGRWLDAHLSKLTLDQITRECLLQLQQERAAFRGKTKERPAAATVNRCLQFVGRILRKACDEWDWIDKAPKVPLLREPTIRVAFLTESQIERLLDEAPDHMRPMIVFALETGTRMSEMLGLTWDQVSLTERKAWLHADQTKARRARAVPLTAKAIEAIRSQLGGHLRHVFSYRGRPIKRINGRTWRECLSRAGIKNFRWHDLRHTWATRLGMSGASLPEIQALGGWATIEMVQRYAHFAGSHLAAVQDRASKSEVLRLVAA